MLCDLDGVYMSGVCKWGVAEESSRMQWRPVVESYVTLLGICETYADWLVVFETGVAKHL